MSLSPLLGNQYRTYSQCSAQPMPFVKLSVPAVLATPVATPPKVAQPNSFVKRGLLALQDLAYIGLLHRTPATSVQRNRSPPSGNLAVPSSRLFDDFQSHSVFHSFATAPTNILHMDFVHLHGFQRRVTRLIRIALLDLRHPEPCATAQSKFRSPTADLCHPDPVSVVWASACDPAL